jgi:protein-S-isoprenylcysteine O-methyltransferase Ste14
MHLVHAWLISGLWLAWAAYWIVAWGGVKPVRRGESMLSRLSHGAPLLAGFALLTWGQLAGPLLRARFLPPGEAGFWIGVLLVVAGLGFAVAARIQLAGNWSATVTLKQDHELVRHGPYRWVRHPIYTGLLIAILGSAVAEGEWRGPVALALFTVAFLIKSGIEERYLIDQFGDAYAHYRREVPALLPRLL